MNLPKKKRGRKRAIHNIIKNKYPKKSKASAKKYSILFNVYVCVCVCMCMHMCMYVHVRVVYAHTHVHSEVGEDVHSHVLSFSMVFP